MQPILRMADLSQPFILQVDASNDGLRAVLLVRKVMWPMPAESLRPVRKHMRS